MQLPFMAPACVTCIGQDGQVTTLAANGAVYVMFAALALVFTCIIAVVMAFARRARRYAASAESDLFHS
jgi:uncharacterized membrane protein